MAPVMIQVFTSDVAHFHDVTVVRSPAGGFLGIAAAVLVVLLIVTAARHRRHAGATEQRLCRACAQPHPPFARFCRRCGRALLGNAD
jgi:hypothetical protein